MMFNCQYSRRLLSGSLFLLLCSTHLCAATEEIVIEPQPLIVKSATDTTTQVNDTFLQTVTSLAKNLPRTKRNPFSPTRELIQERLKPTVSTKTQTFTPQVTTKELPKMFLRGHLTGPNGDMVALLQIDEGEVYIVREGDTIGLHDFGFDTVLRIQKISRLHLVVESGTLGQLIIVR